jgi:hypothetical protein
LTIVGAIVGGVVGICMIVGGVFYCRRQKVMHLRPASSQTVGSKIIELQGSKGYFSELTGSQSNVYEMSGESYTRRWGCIAIFKALFSDKHVMLDMMVPSWPLESSHCGYRFVYMRSMSTEKLVASTWP